MGKEIWKDVFGYEGIYQVSSYGRVINLKYSEKRLCHLSITKGYAHSTLIYKNKRKVFRIHRLVASHFIPNYKNKEEVNHIDGDKLNNNVNNLEWSTRSENQIHAVRTGLVKTIGEGANFSKLKESEVRSILQQKEYGVMSKDLAAKYNVSSTTITCITKRKSWKHLRL